MNEPMVFIIDDDPSAIRGLARLVRAAGFKVETFTSAADFLDFGKLDGPGCIVLDVRMPKMTGPELQEQLGKDEYVMPIIFLSAHGDVSTTAEAMKKGAVDFLTKPVDRDDLLVAIRVSLAKDAENRAQRAEISSIREQINALTPREYEVMTYVITGMLNKQIAAELGISEETVKIHRGRVMQKLGIASAVELVRICEKAGIKPYQPQR
jgi:FixJ family two-component response regulator